jgi:NAD(P)-dependent dehydrogenase (short-subunit alcohol dehydrogenase family)
MAVIIVTGASKGIGASVVEQLLADKSNRVLAVARSEEPLRNLIIKYGEDRVATIAGDVADAETAGKIIELAIDRFGQIDSIVANAGVLEPVDRIELAAIDEWKKLFDVNFFSIVSLVSQALPHLRKTKGRVVVVSSGASTKAYYGWGAYGASKAAINHFVLQLSSEEADISAVSVAPGVVDTGMQADIRDKFGQNMTADALKRFTDLKSNNELLHPSVPAAVYANLAARGFPAEINGKYLRYNDPLLESYQL